MQKTAITKLTRCAGVPHLAFKAHCAKGRATSLYANFIRKHRAGFSEAAVLTALLENII